MAKARTTRQISSEHEAHVAKAFGDWNGKASSSSGASPAYPHDVESDLYVTECKATEGKSISVKLEDWLKIRHRAGNGRLPSMAFRFRDPYTGKHIDLFMKELDEEIDSLECQEAAATIRREEIMDDEWMGPHHHMPGYPCPRCSPELFHSEEKG